MDKHEYQLKTEQMLSFMKEKSYKEAFDIAETIDWKKVKNASVLCAVSEIYEYNGDYQKSRDILFLAYDKSPDSRKIVYRLGTLALKLGEIKEAVDCYDEFVGIAPKDPNRFILKYKILKSKKAPIQEQIEALEEFKKIEYVEKWSFELAKLYHEAGMITECLEECDDLILWFSEGKYIYNAMELKMQYKPLTPLQHEKYVNRFGESAEESAETPVVEETSVEATTVEETMVEETPVEETPVEELVETPVTEEVPAEETAADGTEEKPTLTIEEMVQGWEETQRENAQMIQAEFEKVELAKAQQEAEAVEEEKEEILSDDVRRLMEELEAESAEIEAQKTVQEPEVFVAPVAPETVETPVEVNVEETFVERESLAKAIQEVEEEPEPQEDEIKLGDTQQIALSTKALANAARVDVPDEAVEIPYVPEQPTVSTGSPYDTGFVVQGKYDLDAHSQIGLEAGLTEEEKKIFSYFVPVHGMSEQLVKVLQADRACKTRYGTSRIGNVVIVGRKGSGKTVLAVDIVKAIQKSRGIRQGKVAIVKAESLNNKDVRDIVSKLNGGALVIEKAARLKRNAIESLCDVMEGQTGELLVVLEDERKPIEKLFAEYPNFRKKFTSRIDVPVFINDELVTFGQTYAKENGYKIDEMGILALYTDIDILQREEKVVTVADVKAIVDDAIENANRASVKNVIKKIFGKSRDESDRVILKEEHFR